MLTLKTDWNGIVQFSQRKDIGIRDTRKRVNNTKTPTSVYVIEENKKENQHRSRTHKKSCIIISKGGYLKPL